MNPNEGLEGSEAPLIGHLASGEVVADRPRSHLHPDVIRFLPDALRQIRSGGKSYIDVEVDFGREIGFTACVATRPDDAIVYAKRRKRMGFTRFVKNRMPEPCSSVFVVLKRATPGIYLLITAFIGRAAHCEPWDPAATETSWNFWNCHALLWGSAEVVPGTETTHCPW